MHVESEVTAQRTDGGPAARVLMVDDDPGIRDVVSDFLRRHGFAVHTAGDGNEMEQVLARGPVDLVVLDIMLPGEDGLAICRRIAGPEGPAIIVLSAMGEETDRIIGLELGADDYVPKPFNPRELLARIRAVLRRAGDATNRRAEASTRNLRFAGWTLVPARRRLLNPDGADVALTGGEYDLLVALVERANRVLTRDMLLDLLRGRQAGPFDRAIDVAVSRRRRKLEDDGRNAQLIKTVRGGGYVLAAMVERA